MVITSARIVSIVGTRPHLTKLASIAKAFAKSDAEHIVLHTGQHYDPELASNFIEPLQLPVFEKLYEAGNKTPEDQFAYILSNLTKDLRKLKPDLVIVYGDTTTTAAAAISAALCKIPIAHVEAGLREYTYAVPEECNKRLTDSISTLFFCPSEEAVRQLTHEGIHPTAIKNTGDTALDLLTWPSPTSTKAWSKQQMLKERNYALCTFHREVNTDNPERLKSIVKALSELNEEILLPLHPRTKKALATNEIQLPGNISAIPPIGFFELQAAIKNAKFVLTDSGGVTKEAYQQQKMVLLLDDQTEWLEAVKEGWVLVVGSDSNRIQLESKTLKIPKVHTKPYGDGTAGQKVVDECLAYLREIRKKNSSPRSPYRRW